MKTPFILFVTSLIGLSACSRKQEASTFDTSPLTPQQEAQIESEYIFPTNAQAEAAPTGAASATAQARPQTMRQPLQQRLNGAINATLTIQLRAYVEKNGHMPGNFAEFINASMDTAPPAPDGMKFVIDEADKSVRVVKK